MAKLSSDTTLRSPFLSAICKSEQPTFIGGHPIIDARIAGKTLDELFVFGGAVLILMNPMTSNAYFQDGNIEIAIGFL